uniref:Semigranular hemocyte specific kazal-type proteinase inhibitor n=1 Tax=Pacifastacus leniusculus TaxID=6720 RepID=B5L664_PACLE|nr:semigranular hemocyte specific kazal-type proteinase inhibitor [Pacifastacus leniusculus]
MAPRATLLLAVVLVVLVVHAQCTSPTRPIGGLCGRYCGRDLRPVCGSNGRTYHNACLLENARCVDPTITHQHEGPCATGGGGGRRLCARYCGSTVNPVCGSDGTTYPNQCMLEIAQCNDDTLARAYNGECTG